MIMLILDSSYTRLYKHHRSLLINDTMGIKNKK